MKTRAVIFDLDGTLLYTLGDIADSVNTVLERYGFPVFTDEEYKKMVGHGLRSLLEQITRDRQMDEKDFENAYLEVLNEYNSHCVDRTIPYKGIPSLLDTLSSEGVRLAVLSNKEDLLVQLIVEKLLNKWPFDFIYGTRPGVEKKPHPGVLHHIIREMNLTPEEALYVGDSGVDMITAVNAGVTGVGVTWGYKSSEELLAAGAEVLIDKPADLLKIVAGGL